jgi:hypothetical protein
VVDRSGGTLARRIWWRIFKCTAAFNDSWFNGEELLSENLGLDELKKLEVVD